MRSFTLLPTDYVTLPTNSTTQQPALVVSSEPVYRKLTKLNRSKAHGPDGIPGWVLKRKCRFTGSAESRYSEFILSGR